MALSRLRHPLLVAALSLGAALPLSLGGALPPPVQAQVPLNEVRALNFARNTGIGINGGLIAYRPQACMFSTSAATNPCLIRSDSKGFLYRFLGGPPGWQSTNQPAPIETELLVAPDGRSLVKVLYNGPPRQRR
jgi:hypothetical protein